MSFSLSHGKPIDVAHFGIDQDQLPPLDDGPINPKTWFGPQNADHPLELEIGSGKGTFLVQQATATPQVNYLGIEYARSFWRYAADRCRRHGLENVRLVHTEAAAFVQYRLPNACLRKVHIYFPDPWPKKRHHKRRLIQAPFLRLLHPKLEPAARVHITTDHTSYYQWILEHAHQVDDLYERSPFQALGSAQEGELVGTNFERKYRRLGRSFHAITLHKRG